MAFIQSIISRVARISARTKILQDKIVGGGIKSSLDRISSKFVSLELDSTEVNSLFEQAKEADFNAKELEKLGASNEDVFAAQTEAADRFERFRDSYAT